MARAVTVADRAERLSWIVARECCQYRLLCIRGRDGCYPFGASYSVDSTAPPFSLVLLSLCSTDSRCKHSSLTSGTRTLKCTPCLHLAIELNTDPEIPALLFPPRGSHIFKSTSFCGNTCLLEFAAVSFRVSRLLQNFTYSGQMISNLVPYSFLSDFYHFSVTGIRISKWQKWSSNAALTNCCFGRIRSIERWEVKFC